MRSQKLQWVEKLFPTFFITCLLVSAVASHLAQAQNYKFKVLHTFHGKDGANPSGPLIWDGHGNLIGLTGNGGTGTCFHLSGCGTVFKANISGKLLWSYSLKNYSEGFEPLGNVYQDTAGNLFGITNLGGIVPCFSGDIYGCGTVFRLDSAMKETVLHRFRGPFNGYHDGYYGEGSPIEDGAGNLYGSAEMGGTGNNGGIVFRVTQSGKETILHSFPGPTCQPGGGPATAVVLLTGDQRLYGNACGGGMHSQGMAFRMTTAGKMAVLYNYSGGGGPSNAGNFVPYGGNLYGAAGGGSGNCGGGGCGTLFELSSSGGSWTEKTLYIFCQISGCKDGESPNSQLVMDSAGNIYGTTLEGGNYPDCYNGGTCGVVFKLDTSGNETVLYSFRGGSDGTFPMGVIRDPKGNLYGVAAQGGDLNCPGSGGHGCGVIFEITP